MQDTSSVSLSWYKGPMQVAFTLSLQPIKHLDYSQIHAHILNDTAIFFIIYLTFIALHKDIFLKGYIAE